MRRIISLALAVCMALSSTAMSLSAAAEEFPSDELTAVQTDPPQEENGLERIECSVEDIALQFGGFGAAGMPVLFGSNEDSDEAGAKQAILDGLRQKSWKIFLVDYHIPASEIRRLYAEVLDESPELFYVTGSFNVYTDIDSVVKCLEPEYENGAEEKETAYQEAIQTALQCVNDSMSDAEKLLALHDYLAQHVSYDTTLSNYSAFDALVNRSAVCQGYTLAYKVLLDEIGIESTYAHSVAMNHIWNVVKLDGQWYHVDVTWDDPLLGQNDMTGYAGHEYFLNSDDKITEGEHYSWQCDYQCDDKSYDGGWYWLDTETAVIFRGDGIYYFRTSYDRGTMTLVKREADGAESDLLTLSMFWPVWGSTDPFFGPYASLSQDDTGLYYNDGQSIYRYTETEGPTQVYTYPCNDGVLYGSHYVDGKMELGVAADLYIGMHCVTLDISQEIANGTWFGPPPIDTESVQISAETFPDETFRTYIQQKIDTDQNGKLSSAECQAVTEIDVSNTPVADLTGIQYFPNLQILNSSHYQDDYNGQLRTLDLSRNTGLQTVNLGNNKLTAINVSMLPELQFLNVENNCLESLDVSANPGLRQLSAGGNPIPELDLSGNPELTYLSLSGQGTPITELDLHHNPQLGFLSLYYLPNLESIDLSTNTKLETLYVRRTAMKQLDVSQNTELTVLDILDSDIRALDLRSNTKLKAFVGDDSAVLAVDLPAQELETFSVQHSENAMYFPTLTVRDGAIDFKEYGLSAGQCAKVTVAGGAYDKETGILTGEFGAGGTIEVSYATGNEYHPTMTVTARYTNSDAGVITSSQYSIGEDGTLSGFNEKMTVDALLNDLQPADRLVIRNRSGNLLSGDKYVGTGCTIMIDGVPESMITALLYGDLDGSGAIEVIDLIMISQSLLCLIELDAVQARASAPCSMGTREATVADIIRIQQYMLDLIPSVC